MSLQRIFEPLVLAERLQARLYYQIEALDNVLTDIPSDHQPGRLAVIQAIQQLRTAVRYFEFAKLMFLPLNP